MMKDIVIDASVALKWFQPQEDGSAEASQLLKDAAQGQIRLYAPTLLILEITNVLVKRKKISPETVAQIVAEIVQLPITFVDVSIEEYVSLLPYMKKYDLTAYDALYLHLAHLKNAQLVTADQQLLAASRVPLQLV